MSAQCQHAFDDSRHNDKVPIDRVAVTNYRSIADSGQLPLGPITLLVGPNNSGKSALLRAIYLAQSGQYQPLDRRLRSNSLPSISLGMSGPSARVVWKLVPNTPTPRPALTDEDLISVVVRFNGGSPEGLFVGVEGSKPTHTGPLSNLRPNNLLVPIFSRRKTMNYENSVNSERGRHITENDSGITSRLSMLLAGDNPEGLRYRELMQHVLGVFVGVFPNEHGHQPGLAITPDETIPLDRMGEGVSGALVLLAELASPGARTFLIEEPENDLHPKALRELVNVILDAVPEKQFIVSTHSDLVLRHLGSIDGATIYRTTMRLDGGVPTTSFLPVADAFDRYDLLEELGYEASTALGWLIFEESTAERIVNQILIPEFAPRLAALRSVSARGASGVIPHFEDLHRTVLFAHLSGDRRAWVIVDGDAAGQRATKELKRRYKDWPAERFVNLPRDAFEKFYPPRFEKAASKALACRDGREKMRLKGALVDEICAWARKEPELAKADFAKSATEVVAVLVGIEEQLRHLST
jgi:AAA domain, putative AbiEii toxin, Type IV TA system/AAA ATPase domain